MTLLRCLLASALVAACSPPAPAPSSPVARPDPPATVAPVEAPVEAPVTMEPPDEPPPPPPLAGDPLRALAVPGFAAAVVSVPVGSTGVRPVVVATHGNYDRPEWQCQVWRQIVQSRGFVLCPRGVRRADSPGPGDARFEYASNQALEREIDAGLAALREAFTGRVADGPVVFAGFSLGAIMGVPIATRHPERFDRLVLIEGGDRWSIDAARTFAKGGGQRVLFACSQPGCAASARTALSILKRASVTAEAVKGKSEGHTYVGDVMERYTERFAWLTEGDPRWQ